MGSYVLVLGPLPSYFTQDPPVPKRRILDLSCTTPPQPRSVTENSLFPPQFKKRLGSVLTFRSNRTFPIWDLPNEGGGGV